VDRALIDAGRTFLVFRARRGALDPGDAHVAVDGGALDTLDPALAADFDALDRVARSQVPVLVLGDTGTGKERVARAVHEASRRRGACVAVNCAALPANLVESELYGYRRGAFSGATEDRPGLVRASDGGTLFLDEVGDLAAASQASLLRALQEREVVPLGATSPIPVDLRVVAATCQALDALVALGRFREDLLARLAGHVVQLPPLRERTEDLGLLIARLLARHGGGRAIALDRELARALFRHAWPRNVRELEHALAAAIARADGDELGLAHLPADFAARPTRAEPPDRERLERLFEQHAGNITKVAKALGTSRSQVRRLATRVGIDLDRWR
jgi:transcriptional regulator with PAS, ATPase and Fis domain